MAKILVIPVPSANKPPFEVEGTLTFRDFHGYGRVFYINDRSYSEHIVTVLEE